MLGGVTEDTDSQGGYKKGWHTGKGDPGPSVAFHSHRREGLQVRGYEGSAHPEAEVTQNWEQTWPGMAGKEGCCFGQ